jgi:hypothetical protein
MNGGLIFFLLAERLLPYQQAVAMGRQAVVATKKHEVK